MKNVSKPKPKFLHCFRPMVDMDMVVLESSKRVRIVEKEENKKASSLTKTMSLASSLTKTMSLDRECSSVKSETSKMPPRPNKTFSRVIKALLFETILAKRARDRKGYRQDSSGSSKRRLSLDLGSDELLKLEETKPNLEMSHSSSSSGTTSSLISRSSSGSESKILSKNLSDSTKQSRNHQDPPEKSKNKELGSSRFNSGIYMLLISLAITVFWGRLFAIFVTSIWLYFLPNLRPAENVARKGWSEAECSDNKRRVIMEGLIERKNHQSQKDDKGH